MLEIFIYIQSFFFLYLFLSFFIPEEYTHSCSTFVIKTKDNHVFGRNFDFPTGVAYLMTNHRGLEKTALVAPDENPARWLSKYGSITFNQMGKEFPYCGMNERGLVVAQMMCAEGQEFCAPDDRPALISLQWIQYQLDTSATVNDVIASEKFVRFVRDAVPIHFLTTDANGDSAVIEHIGGRQVHYTGNTLPVAALTNTTYKESLEQNSKFIKKGAPMDIWGFTGSVQRFARISEMLERYYKDPSDPVVRYSFRVLYTVAQGEQTQWSAVYEPLKLMIHFHTRVNGNIRKINFKEFDFTGDAPPLVVDIDEDDMEIENWEPFTIELNRKLIEQSMKECEYIKNSLTGIEDYWINYPDQIKQKQ